MYKIEGLKGNTVLQISNYNWWGLEAWHYALKRVLIGSWEGYI